MYNAHNTSREERKPLLEYVELPYISPGNSINADVGGGCEQKKRPREEPNLEPRFKNHYHSGSPGSFIDSEEREGRFLNYSDLEDDAIDLGKKHMKQFLKYSSMSSKEAQEILKLLKIGKDTTDRKNERTFTRKFDSQHPWYPFYFFGQRGHQLLIQKSFVSLPRDANSNADGSNQYLAYICEESVIAKSNVTRDVVRCGLGLYAYLFCILSFLLVGMGIFISLLSQFDVFAAQLTNFFTGKHIDKETLGVVIPFFLACLFLLSSLVLVCCCLGGLYCSTCVCGLCAQCCTTIFRWYGEAAVKCEKCFNISAAHRLADPFDKPYSGLTGLVYVEEALPAALERGDDDVHVLNMKPFGKESSSWKYAEEFYWIVVNLLENDDDNVLNFKFFGALWELRRAYPDYVERVLIQNAKNVDALNWRIRNKFQWHVRSMAEKEKGDRRSRTNSTIPTPSSSASKSIDYYWKLETLNNMKRKGKTLKIQLKAIDVKGKQLMEMKKKQDSEIKKRERLVETQEIERVLKNVQCKKNFDKVFSIKKALGYDKDEKRQGSKSRVFLVSFLPGLIMQPNQNIMESTGGACVEFSDLVLKVLVNNFKGGRRKHELSPYTDYRNSPKYIRDHLMRGECPGIDIHENLVRIHCNWIGETPASIQNHEEWKNVASTKDLRTKNTVFILMEKCDETLHDAITRLGVPIFKRNALFWKFLSDITSGLTCLLDNLIIHRDIKPDNLFRKGDVWKVGDYGCCYNGSFNFFNAHDKPFVIRETLGVGSVAYQPPEFRSVDSTVLSQGVVIDKWDVWSLGLVCFQMFSKRSIDWKDDDTEADLELTTEECSNPFIRMIVAKMLEKSYEKRISLRELNDYAIKKSSTPERPIQSRSIPARPNQRPRRREEEIDLGE